MTESATLYSVFPSGGVEADELNEAIPVNH
jgi:hypothetical protein